VRIEIRFNDDVAVVGLSGRFVAGSDGPFLRQKVKDLVDAGAKMLVIDFSEVPYIDSTGLGFLAGCRVTTQNAGTSMVLAGVNEHVKKILDRVKLSQFFVLSEDEAAAVKRVKELIDLPGDAALPAAKTPKARKRTPDTTTL
jgi:anti-sigma B factor antagonist